MRRSLACFRFLFPPASCVPLGLYVDADGSLSFCPNGVVRTLDSTPANAAFHDLTAGTNTTAAMVVGTGASLTTSGTGTIGGAVLAKSLNLTLFADQFAGATAGAKISAAITALDGPGGTVNACGFSGPQTIPSTVTVPANTTVLLAPVVFKASSTAFILNADGAKLLGCNYAGTQVTAAAQVGTVIRQSGYGGTTDMIQATGSDSGSGAFIGGIEIGNLTLDFADTTAATGRDAILIHNVRGFHIHDIRIFNPGRKGMFLNPGKQAVYDGTIERVTVTAAGEGGFDLNTTGGTSDIDRITCNNCRYGGYNAGDAISQFGTYGFRLLTPGGSTVTQGISDIVLDNCHVDGVISNAANAAIKITQAGSAPVSFLNVISGEYEDSLGLNAASAFTIASASPTLVHSLNIDLHQANFTTSENISTTTAYNYVVRQPYPQVTETDGIQFAPLATPRATTFNPNGGIRWNSNRGIYLHHMGTDGILRVSRTDTGPSDIWFFDHGNNIIMPATDATGSLGGSLNRWLNVRSYEINALNGYTINGAAPSNHMLLGNGVRYVDAASVPSSIITANGQNLFGGTAPTMGACGSTPSPTLATGASNNSFTINVGGGAVTSCTVNFGTNFTNVPTCVANVGTLSTGVYISAVSVSAVTFSSSLSIGGGKSFAQCF